jgi:hypothetical protein
MTQTTHAHSRTTATAPCAHDLVGTACQVCGSESHVVSCRHAPTFPLSGTYFPPISHIQDAPPFLFPLLRNVVVFFTGNTREQVSIPTSQIRADDRLQDQKNAMCDPGAYRQSASLHHQPSLVRMWSINNRTLKHLYVLQPAARSLQKEDPQQTNEQNSSMSSFRTTQSRRAKRALLRSFSRITDRAMRVLFF